MIRRLDRYVAREFITLFVLFSLAAPLLFVLADWTDNIDTYTERSLDPLQVALGYLYMMPQFILFSIPIAGLIATVFTVSNMTRHSELAAAKAGGISFYRATIMLPVLGLVLTVGGLALSEVVPVSLRRANAYHGEQQTLQSRNDFVYRSEGGYVFSIRQLDPENGRITGLTVEREGDREAVPDLHMVADEATWDSAGGWVLRGGYLRLFPPGGAERLYRFDDVRLPRFTEQPDQLLAVPNEPDEMRYEELGRFIAILERSGSEPYDLRVQQALKLAIPAATLIIVLIGAPLANAQPRGGAAYGIGVSLGITILYLMLIRVFEAIGSTGALSPVVAAWTPNAIFALAAIILLARVRT
jgi:lipopolysaccharide export system permease protein